MEVPAPDQIEIPRHVDHRSSGHTLSFGKTFRLPDKRKNIHISKPCGPQPSLSECSVRESIVAKW